MLKIVNFMNYQEILDFWFDPKTKTGGLAKMMRSMHSSKKI